MTVRVATIGLHLNLQQRDGLNEGSLPDGLALTINRCIHLNPAVSAVRKKDSETLVAGRDRRIVRRLVSFTNHFPYAQIP